LTILSELFFVAASALYVWLSIISLNYDQKLASMPSNITDYTDDYTWNYYGWTDDYVFQTPNKGTYVSKYQIVYSAAAFLFIFVGVLDCFLRARLLATWFILAGSFGFASAAVLESNERLSNIFNCVSVQLFCVEAFTLLFGRDEEGCIKRWLRVGDLFFVCGTCIDVALSYIYLFGTPNIALTRLGIFSASCWLTCSIMYLSGTLYMGKCGRSYQDNDEWDGDDNYLNKRTSAAVQNSLDTTEARSRSTDCSEDGHDIDKTQPVAVSFEVASSTSGSMDEDGNPIEKGSFEVML
jgi:hypothetical protein